jgi:hypothetical protein
MIASGYPASGSSRIGGSDLPSTIDSERVFGTMRQCALGVMYRGVGWFLDKFVRPVVIDSKNCFDLWEGEIIANDRELGAFCELGADQELGAFSFHISILP